jgi:Protein of unknown function (DUF3572)
LKNVTNVADAASDIALKLLSFMADDGALFRFMDISGIDPQSLKNQIAEPSFHAALLDFALSDETLLLAFAANAGLNPAEIIRFRSKLPGFIHE